MKLAFAIPTIPTNRQRKKFDESKLVELMESITGPSGLLHPIVVRSDSEGNTILVSGERRFRAITMAHDLGQPFTCGGITVPSGQYPCLHVGDLSPEDAYEAELEENIRRDDLTWQEQAAATAKLMELRTIQARRAGSAQPTAATIAQEVRGSSDGSNQSHVRTELILSRHLNNPAVAKAKTAKEAMKVLKHEESQEKNRKLAATVGTTFSQQDHTLLQGNCLDVLATLVGPSKEKFDCLLTDPPYGMGAETFGDSGGRVAASGHEYDDSYDTWRTLVLNFVPAVTAVMKATAHAYVFCDPDRFAELRLAFQSCGWEVFRTPLIWHNPSGMRTPWPSYGPQRKYQTCLYAVRGKKSAMRIAPDLVTFGSDENIGHAAQKPVDLFKDFLSRTCRIGDSVIDPFCGSGPIFPAAHALKVKATGIEMDAAHYGLAAKRLGEIK